MSRQTAKWERPFTPKRYLHPPFAEYMLTMWPDCRVMCGEIDDTRTHFWHSSAFRLLYGADWEGLDFTQVQYETREDGVPIHAYTQKMGDCTVHMESFGVFDEGETRIPTAYSTFTITNPTDRAITDEFGILARTGLEENLTGMEVDGYDHFDNNVHNWGFLPSKWEPTHLSDDHITLSDGEYFLRLQELAGLTAVWQGDVPGLVWAQRRMLRLTFTLAPGESLSFTAAFRIGKGADHTQDPWEQPYDLRAAYTKDLLFWLGELKRLKHFPGLPQHRAMVCSMVLQCLQVFCYPVGKDYVLPRQGGLQRAIWPCEAMEFLMALDRIGDFRDYTDTAYETYFFHLQSTTGENVGAVQNLFGNFWGSITGGSCWSCAYHILALDDRTLFDRFRDKLLAGFGWMERQRAKTRNGEYEGVGIFPPMQSCDWPGYGQAWCFTDGTNLEGYRHLAMLFEHFDDPKAGELRTAYEDYMACMKKILNDQLAKNDRSDEILLPAELGAPMSDPPSGAYFSDGPGMLLRCCVMEPGSEGMRLLENFFRNRGVIRNGLTGLMNDGMIRQGANSDPYAGHTWYTTFSEMYWYYAWLQNGEYDKARETLEAQLRYAMSPEYYVNERYADNDPYWVPWCPNASGNGRLLMMLCDCLPLYEAVNE